jgi:uncharacterized BrkB/YihY/UPF0761 family membrane protein
VTLLYRFAPSARLVARRAIVGGSVVAVSLWVAFTGLLSLYFSFGSSTPYGPLLSIIALLIWSMLSSLSLHLGIATACTLSGARRPKGSPGWERNARASPSTRARYPQPLRGASVTR